MAAYATIAQLKTRLGITDISKDALLQELLDQAAAYIESYTGRSWRKEGQTATPITMTETFYGAKGNVVYLAHRGITGITSISLNDATETVASTAYRFDTLGRLEFLSVVSDLWRYVIHPHNRASYTISGDKLAVTYTYVPEVAPADIVMANLDIAQGYYSNTYEPNAASIAQESLGDYSVTYGGSVQSGGGYRVNTLDVLKNYRVRNV